MPLTSDEQEYILLIPALKEEPDDANAAKATILKLKKLVKVLMPLIHDRELRKDYLAPDEWTEKHQQGLNDRNENKIKVEERIKDLSKNWGFDLSESGS